MKRVAAPAAAVVVAVSQLLSASPQAAEPAGPGRAPAAVTSPVELPLLHPGTVRGGGTAAAVHAGGRAARAVDGSRDDWVGEATWFGGTVSLSAGELIYTDHLFDARGADDGADAERDEVLGPAEEAAPDLYRVEALIHEDPASQFGFDAPPALKGDEAYGDAPLQDVADLVELRLAADRSTLYVMARTTTMHEPGDVAVLLLVDVDGESGDDRPVPFGAGIRSSAAEIAVLLAHGAGRAVDLSTGEETPVAVAVNPDGYENVVEAAVPRALLGRDVPGKGRGAGKGGGGVGQGPPFVRDVRVAAATGRYDAASRELAALGDLPARLANVAFRTDEPVRVWFERDQALALHRGSIDPFLYDVDLRALEAGTTRPWRPGPGYHERIFLSAGDISVGQGLEGVHQHYGVYLPSSHAVGSPAPLTFWMHWRGGKAHSAAAVAPRIMRDLGESRGGIVVSPRGRGTSTWYLGRGMLDFHEVWADVFRTFAVDVDRVYVSGHSMGGWGSYVLAILYPDRFAGALPVAGPVTQGAWTGLDFDGCDELTYTDGGNRYRPCYVDTNDGDARTQHTRRLLANLRNVPIAIFQGGADELVPTAGVTRQVEELVRLGYRHRYYLFPSYEHYSHPVVDEWMEGARYLEGFRRDPDPPRVTYVRDMPFERTVERGMASQARLARPASLDFDRAYWMSGLTPADPVEGVARFDGRSLAIPERPAIVLPEAGGPAAPGQVGPYAMSGLRWVDDPGATPPAASNGFEATLDGAAAVQLDLARMRIDPGSTVSGIVTASHALALRLDGGWAAAPAVTVDGLAVTALLDAGVLTVPLAPGTSEVVIG